MSYTALGTPGNVVSAGASGFWVYPSTTDSTTGQMTGFSTVKYALQLVPEDGIKFKGAVSQAANDPRTLSLTLNNGAQLNESFDAVVKKISDPTQNASSATGAENFPEITVQSFLANPDMFFALDHLTDPALVVIPFGRTITAAGANGDTKFFVMLAKRTGAMEWTSKAGEPMTTVWGGGTFTATAAGDTAADGLSFASLSPPGETALQPENMTAAIWTDLKAGKYAILDKFTS